MEKVYENPFQYKDTFLEELRSFNVNINKLVLILKNGLENEMVSDFLNENGDKLDNSLFLNGFYIRQGTGDRVESPVNRSLESLKETAKDLHCFLKNNISSNKVKNKMNMVKNIDEFIDSLINETSNFTNVEEMFNFIKDFLIKKYSNSGITRFDFNFNDELKKELDLKLKKTFEYLQIHKAYLHIEESIKESKEKLYGFLIEKS